MQYHLAPLFCRPWTLNGITPRLIESHYEGNYGSALRRLNAITEELETLDPATTSAEAVNRLKRDEAAMLNSTLLHELYFASLGGDGRTVPEAMAAALVRDFGSTDRWRQEFIALANALAGGSGWVLLTYVPRDGRLINQSGADHGQNIAGGIPILALDMYEHAYHIDFGANAPAYVAAFMRNIDWSAVEGRYEDATRVAPPRPLEQKQFADVPAMTVEEVKAMLDSGDRLPDHRRAAATLYDASAGHHGRRRVARSRAARRVDRRAVEDRPRRHLLRLRLPCRLRDGDCAPQGRLRRALHGRRPLRLEGDRR